MAKTKISEFSSTPANNTDIDSINIAEGCAPSGINDAIRELMAQLKDFQTGAQGDSFNGPIGTSTAAAGAFTTLSATGAITSTLATGTAPLVIASTTKVANLNVDLLDGADWASPAALGSTTPAAVSATTLAASGAVTLSGGTANGVAYLNGSKVVTSGSALTFDGSSLGMGSPTVYGTRSLNSYTGTTASAIGFSQQISGFANTFLGSNNSGSSVLGMATGTFGQSTSNSIPWTVSAYGSEQMRLTSTGLGIGTSSPAAKVHSSLSSSGATSETLRLDNPSDSANAGTKLVYRISGWSFDGGFASLTRDGSSGGTIMAFGTSANASTTNASEKLRIDSAGNVGIGTSSPSAKLNVFAGGVVARFGAFGTTTYDDFQIESYAGSTGIGCRGSSNLYFAMNGTTRMYLTSSGNFGIGTSSPSYPLHIVSTSTTTAAFKNSTAANSQIIVGNTAGDLQIRALASGDSFIFSDTSKYLAFGTNGATERMRIDSSGNLLVGQTSTGSGGLVNSNSAALTLSSNGSCWTMNHSATSAGSLFAQFGYSGTKIGSITVATSSTVAYNTSSDYRLKENIAPMTGALAKVALLKPCTYTWKIDGSNGQGFIAHELAEVCPEAVTGEKDAVNEDGTINPQGIDTSFLVATLTAAIQEQQAIINQLKARLDAANL